MKRKREKHITRLHIILFFFTIIIVLVVFLSIRGCSNKKIEKYKDYEKAIEKSGKLYFKLNDLVFKEGYEERVDIKELAKNGLIESDITKECKGYLIIDMTSDMYTGEEDPDYRAYIKCGEDYTTVNYSEY